MTVPLFLPSFSAPTSSAVNSTWGSKWLGKQALLATALPRAEPWLMVMRLKADLQTFLMLMSICQTRHGLSSSQCPLCPATSSLPPYKGVAHPQTPATVRFSTSCCALYMYHCLNPAAVRSCQRGSSERLIRLMWAEHRHICLTCTKWLTSRLSKSSPPRCVSPAVALTSKMPSSMLSSDTSKVPPPRSKINTLRS